MRFFFFLRLVLAGIFLYAGVIKASASAEFAMALVPFTFLPEGSIRLISLFLPLIEILGAVLLFFRRTKFLGAAILLLLCLLFIGLLTWALMNGIIVSCACFGNDETPSAAKMVLAIVRDIFLALTAVTILAENYLRGIRSPRNSDTFQKIPANDSES